MSLLFDMLSRLVITFLPRSKHFLIWWLQSPSAVTLEPKNIKSVTVSPSICHEVMGPDAMILVYWILNFMPVFFTLLFYFHQETLLFLFVFCHKGGVIYMSEVIDIFPSNLDSSLWFIWPGIFMMDSEFKINSRMKIYNLVLHLSQFWTSHIFQIQFSLFLLDLQVSQEVCYSHLFKSFPQNVIYL